MQKLWSVFFLTLGRMNLEEHWNMHFWAYFLFVILFSQHRQKRTAIVFVNVAALPRRFRRILPYQLVAVLISSLLQHNTQLKRKWFILWLWYCLKKMGLLGPHSKPESALELHKVLDETVVFLTKLTVKSTVNCKHSTLDDLWSITYPCIFFRSTSIQLPIMAWNIFFEHGWIAELECYSFQHCVTYIFSHFCAHLALIKV